VTLDQIVNAVYGELGNRFQLSESEVIRHVSQIQQMAFAKDLDCFMSWTNTVALANDLTDPSLKSKGPYSWPTDCRRLLGVTAADDEQILAGVPNIQGAFPWEPGRIQRIGAKWFFALNPDADSTYRWVYYIRPDDLTTTTDDAKLLIPKEWHQRLLVNGALMLGDSSLWGDRPMTEIEKTILEPFWEDMAGESGDTAPLVSQGAW